MAPLLLIDEVEDIFGALKAEMVHILQMNISGIMEAVHIFPQNFVAIGNRHLMIEPMYTPTNLKILLVC